MKFILIIKSNITLIVFMNGFMILGFDSTMREAFIEVFMQHACPLFIIWSSSYPLTFPASVSKISLVYWMMLPMENQNINIGAVVSYKMILKSLYLYNKLSNSTRSSRKLSTNGSWCEGRWYNWNIEQHELLQWIWIGCNKTFENGRATARRR